MTTGGGMRRLIELTHEVFNPSLLRNVSPSSCLVAPEASGAVTVGAASEPSFAVTARAAIPETPNTEATFAAVTFTVHERLGLAAPRRHGTSTDLSVMSAALQTPSLLRV